MAGNASRLALHTAFRKIPFFSTYEFFGPNCIGSFAMGLFATLLPAEAAMPLVHRALCVGFCGSFTTLSSWVVDLANKGSAAGAFEELISGITMPFIFFLWGKDMSLGMRWIVRSLNESGKGHDAHDTPPTKHEAEAVQREPGRTYMIVGIVFLTLSCAAAVAIPIGVQVRINQGHIHMVGSRDIDAVAMGPAGATVRFLLSVFLNKRPQWKGFPVGTIAANALGCFLVVFMDNYSSRRPHNQWFWIVANGVCGALSTVSSLVNEVWQFHSTDRRFMAYAYLIGTLAITITIGAIGRRRSFD